MRVLVTGATGFVGRHLIPALQRRGHSVRGLVQPASRAEGLEADGVQAFSGDVRDPAALAAAMQGVDAVIHLAAAIGVKYPMDYYVAVNVKGTANVCHAALAAGARRLVHVSSTSVYRQGVGSPVTEDAPLAPMPDPYPVTKAAGDRLVQKMMRHDHLPACIVRAGTIYGPGDGLNFGRIADRLLARRAIVVGRGTNAVPFTYVADVVDGLVLALEHPRAAARIYNIADDRPPTQEEVLQAIAGEVGAVPPRLHVPYSVLYGLACVAEAVAAITRSTHPAVTRFGLALYGADNRIAIARARRELGYEPRVPLQDGVRLTAAWYRQGHPTRQIGQELATR